MLFVVVDDVFGGAAVVAAVAVCLYLRLPANIAYLPGAGPKKRKVGTI